MLKRCTFDYQTSRSRKASPRMYANSLEFFIGANTHACMDIIGGCLRPVWIKIHSQYLSDIPSEKSRLPAL